MKRFFLLLISLLLFNNLYTAPRFSTFIQKSYSELGVIPRVTASGIYAISSFDIVKDQLYLRLFDTQDVVVVGSEKIIRRLTRLRETLDIIGGIDEERVNDASSLSGIDQGRSQRTYRKSFTGGKTELFAEDGGQSVGEYGHTFNVRVISRSDLMIQLDIESLNANFKLEFPGDLAYADLIGIDGIGNVYLLVERYLSDIPLRVHRQIITLSPDGTILSTLDVPLVKYCTTIKEFLIDADGSLYHFMTTHEGARVIRIQGLAEKTADIQQYPENLILSEHYNDFLPCDDLTKQSLQEPVSAADRATALKIGESYVLHTYVCTQTNLAPSDVTAPGGDIVRTPSWLIVGVNARMAYKWGGFNTVAEYDAGLRAGKYLADINTAGVSSYAVGVDCSGFVSRCWQMTYHSSTSDMPNITTQYSTWDELKPGDAVHKVGHVRLFVEKKSNGALCVIESSGRDWGASYWTYTPSDLNGVYTPRYYNGMVTEYSVKRPDLLQASIFSDSVLILKWKCDTAQVEGYRLYGSSDGTQWNILQSETSLHDTSAMVSAIQEAKFFRVSSILRNGVHTESEWSNVLGAGNFSGDKNILIVDGFEKQSGSWRGPGHTFAARYGSALTTGKYRFESIRNSQLTDPRFALTQYDAVFWILGDESTESETFSSAEQLKVQTYLESGGKLFVSGSEIGWDLYEKGTTADKSFYTTYLKAAYKSDNAISGSARGIDGSLFNTCYLVFGQTYAEEYPDEIDTTGGSLLCMRYINLKGAGICYIGKFGTSTKPGSIVYLAFPLETTANDTAFRAVISRTLSYFSGSSSVFQTQEILPTGFSLEQNYPNPFNPTTTIKYTLPQDCYMTLGVFSALGQKVSTLIDGFEKAGSKNVVFKASGLSSGIYFYRLTAGGQTITKKLLLMK